MRTWKTLIPLCTLLSAAVGGVTQAAAPPNPEYVVLAWNDLGMHCYNPDFSNLAILPPYNNLWAQVIKVGDPPQLVTTGVRIEYSILNNTYSVGKTNFWTYAQQLFDLPDPLPANIGLKGKGLSGTLDPDQDHFVAEGIPLTEHLDRPGRSPLAPWLRRLGGPRVDRSDRTNGTVQPFQLASIVVKDALTGAVLARTTTVAPVSSELRCDNCHADGADATASIGGGTGKVETNILAIHDFRSGTRLMEQQPVLCARCHDSNALGMTGGSAQRSLSKAMHSWHNPDRAPDISPDTDGCYNCHPGPKTQCLRDAMSQDFSHQCPDCHGLITDVGADDARQPWLDEPRCDNASCHGAGFALNQPLYRHSQGHGALYCAGCHDSPHAIAPSRESNDSAKFLGLQESAGTLRKCTVCHRTKPAQAFRHRGVQPAP